MLIKLTIPQMRAIYNGLPEFLNFIVLKIQAVQKKEVLLGIRLAVKILDSEIPVNADFLRILIH